MRNTRKKQKINHEMTDLCPQILIITKNVNGLKSSIKRHRLSEWIEKYDTTTCCIKHTTA